jgi:hypothetical protein
MDLPAIPPEMQPNASLAIRACVKANVEPSGDHAMSLALIELSRVSDFVTGSKSHTPSPRSGTVAEKAMREPSGDQATPRAFPRSETSSDMTPFAMSAT